VCLATTAAAVNVTPDLDTNNGAYLTSGSCEHPTQDDAYFEAYITTGAEDGTDELDIKGLAVEMTDLHSPAYGFLVPDAHAVELKYTFGIFDSNGDFSPTSWTFKAGSNLRNGIFESTTKAADVEAVKFDAVWRFLHPNRMRTVSCVIPLDGVDKA
jgi:hypothetical protein